MAAMADRYKYVVLLSNRCHARTRFRPCHPWQTVALPKTYSFRAKALYALLLSTSLLNSHVCTHISNRPLIPSESGLPRP